MMRDKQGFKCVSLYVRGVCVKVELLDSGGGSRGGRRRGRSRGSAIEAERWFCGSPGCRLSFRAFKLQGWIPECLATA